MTKIKLVNGTIINAEDVSVVSGVLKISTKERTVEELAELFSNKENTSHIVLMTPSEIECGFKAGFTSFAGINYNTDGVKTVELFQPVDEMEARLSNAEALAVSASEKASNVEEQNSELFATVDSILTEILPTLMVE